MDEPKPLHLFEGFGIELEYMIVDRATLDVRPIADHLIERVAGEIVSEVELGEIAWSNELVLHVIELKTNRPARSLEGLSVRFEESVRRLRAEAEVERSLILGTGMHPWMDPDREMKLWPHEYSAVYEAYNRIFDCRGHGWANLQSMHLNLPFAGDEEFGRLHAAIRFLLPIMPALSASSPIMDRRPTGLMDSRMQVYRGNSAKIPSMTGKVVPEPVYTRAEYEREILGRIYRDLAPFDPEGVLQDEFANARGAIARFDRSAIEIRVLDVQECPKADIAIAAAITGALRWMIEGGAVDLEKIAAWPVDRLASILESVVRDADRTPIEDRAYLEALQIPGHVQARDIWRHLIDRAEIAGEHAPSLDLILEEGCLARRILARGGDLVETYRALTACLAANTLLL